MTEDEVRELFLALEGLRVVIASEENAAPESSWGDSFFYYDPDATFDQKIPFATIVTRNTPGWDEVSDLDRAGAFRVNLAVGREEVPPVETDVDYAAHDVVLPHPHYAAQGWIAIVNPGSRTAERLAELARVAHARAARRHR